jgi:hypothetical protein
VKSSGSLRNTDRPFVGGAASIGDSRVPAGLHGSAFRERPSDIGE